MLRLGLRAHLEVREDALEDSAARLVPQHAPVVEEQLGLALDARRGQLQHVRLVDVERGVGGQRAEDVVAARGGDALVDESELVEVGLVGERRVGAHRSREEVDAQVLAQTVVRDEEALALDSKVDEPLDARRAVAAAAHDRRPQRDARREHAVDRAALVEVDAHRERELLRC